MKAVTRIVFYDDEHRKFFGEGPYRLLLSVEKTGSLRSAALSMEMAYTKALKLMQQAETSLGFALTERVAGGRGGGGSVLTPQGKEWIARYEAYKNACAKVNEQLYREFFPDKA